MTGGMQDSAGDYIAGKGQAGFQNPGLLLGEERQGYIKHPAWCLAYRGCPSPPTPAWLHCQAFFIGAVGTSQPQL